MLNSLDYGIFLFTAREEREMSRAARQAPGLSYYVVYSVSLCCQTSHRENSSSSDSGEVIFHSRNVPRTCRAAGRQALLRDVRDTEYIYIQTLRTKPPIPLINPDSTPPHTTRPPLPAPRPPPFHSLLSLPATCHTSTRLADPSSGAAERESIEVE